MALTIIRRFRKPVWTSGALTPMPLIGPEACGLSMMARVATVDPDRGRIDKRESFPAVTKRLYNLGGP